MTLLKGVTNQNRLSCEMDQELCQTLSPQNACRLTVQEVRARQRLIDSDWWTLQSSEPGYCSNWLSNGWSLIELLEALRAWRPHEQRLCCEISSASDSCFDRKMKSFFHYSLAFVAFALARPWDNKGRSGDRARASQGTEAGSQKWAKCFGFGWREGVTDHVNPVIKL